MPVHQAGFYTKSNLDKLREAKSKGKSVGVLSLGKYIKGKVKSIIWDDQNDVVKVVADDKQSTKMLDHQITHVNILDT